MTRKPEANIDEKIGDFYEVKGNDVSLKWDDENPEASQISIREKMVAINSEGGKSGIIIKSNGKIIIQGDIDLSAAFGTSIKKGYFTENFLSFIPSTLWTEIPGYLFRIPDISALKGILSRLTDFTNLF